MKTSNKNQYHSRVYTDRPAYADFDPPAKFNAIISIIAKRLKQYPNARMITWRLAKRAARHIPNGRNDLYCRGTARSYGGTNTAAETV